MQLCISMFTLEITQISHTQVVLTFHCRRWQNLPCVANIKHFWYGGSHTCSSTTGTAGAELLTVGGQEALFYVYSDILSVARQDKTSHICKCEKIQIIFPTSLVPCFLSTAVLHMIHKYMDIKSVTCLFVKHCSCSCCCKSLIMKY